jgi:hypothetical protein
MRSSKLKWQTKSHEQEDKSESMGEEAFVIKMQQQRIRVFSVQYKEIKSAHFLQ